MLVRWTISSYDGTEIDYDQEKIDIDEYIQCNLAREKESGQKSFTELEEEYFSDYSFPSGVDPLDEARKTNPDALSDFLKTMIQDDRFLSHPVLLIAECSGMISDDYDLEEPEYIFVLDIAADGKYKILTYSDYGVSYGIAPLSAFVKVANMDIPTIRDFIKAGKPNDPLMLFDFSLVEQINR